MRKKMGAILSLLVLVGSEGHAGSEILKRLGISECVTSIAEIAGAKSVADIFKTRVDALLNPENAKKISASDPDSIAFFSQFTDYAYGDKLFKERGGIYFGKLKDGRVILLRLGVGDAFSQLVGALDGVNVAKNSFLEVLLGARFRDTIGFKILEFNWGGESRLVDQEALPLKESLEDLYQEFKVPETEAGYRVGAIGWDSWEDSIDGIGIAPRYVFGRLLIVFKSPRGPSKSQLENLLTIIESHFNPLK